jgi:Ca2+-binding EF-hand superfamily protein
MHFTEERFMKKSVISGLLISGIMCSSLALAHGGGTGKFMRFFDTNKDGVVTQDEFDAAMNTRFQHMDSDHNGTVSMQEFHNYLRQRRQEHKQAWLKQMDSNGDGSVSQDEYIAYQTKKAQSRFTRLDKNHDGVLNADELGKCSHHRRHHGGKGLFHKLDANGDGVITLEESRAAWSNWFTRLDSNGDKVVTSDEVNAFRQHHFAPKSTQ